MIEMKITVEESLNCDGIRVAIIKYAKWVDDNGILYEKDYWYGGNASYEKRNADEKCPYIGDIIKELYNEYEPDIIKVEPGKNVFRGKPVDNKTVLKFCKNNLEGLKVNITLNYEDLEKLLNKMENVKTLITELKNVAE